MLTKLDPSFKTKNPFPLQQALALDQIIWKAFEEYFKK